MRNPFEVLGLSPKIVKELDEVSLFRLVKACYRALQQVYHPDLISGSGERALELNLAFEALDLQRNPESFRHHRRRYIKRLSRKTLRSRLEELTLKLTRVFREKLLLEENFWEELLRRAQVERHLLCPPPQNLKVQLYDLIAKYRSPFPAFGSRAPFKELYFDPHGELYWRYPQKAPRKAAQVKLIGCVLREKIEPWFLLEKSPGGEDLVAQDYMKAETFRRACLPFLRTTLTPNAYLFSVRHGDFTRLYLEGLILRLTPLEDSPTINVKKPSDSLQICEKYTDFEAPWDFSWP